MPKNTDATFKALIAAVQDHFDAVEIDLGPAMDTRPELGFADPEQRGIQFAQNTLRPCIEATLDRLVPYTQMTCVELAVRLASYALSAAPAEDQDVIVRGFVDGFPSAHRHRLATGIRLETGWVTQGRERPNFPKADG